MREANLPASYFLPVFSMQPMDFPQLSNPWPLTYLFLSSLAFCLENSIIYIYDCFYMTIPT